MNKTELISCYLKTMGISAPAADFLSGDDIHYITGCLSHEEEFLSATRDEWGNWEHDLTDHPYQRPFIDELVLAKLKQHSLQRKSIWPGNHKFACCLTHDLDVISANDFRQLQRRYHNKLKAGEGSSIRNLFHYVYSGLNAVVRPVKNDPLWKLEKWCDAELAHGFTSTYYIYVADTDLHPFDCDIRLNDVLEYRGKRMKLSDLVKQLQKEGFEIGLHGSYYSFDNPVIFKKQKELLESVTGTTVETTRQHFLHYEISKTPLVHSNNNIKTDSTLGFNRAAGYRAGTSFPYYLENNLLEVPQIIMDGALFNSNSYAFTEKQACDLISKTIDQVEETGGCLVINYHPNYFNRTAWWNSYLFLLKELKSRDVWCGSMKNIYKLVENICAV